MSRLELAPNSKNPKCDAEFDLMLHQLLVPRLVAEWVLPVLGISLASSLAACVVVVSTAARQLFAPGLNLKLIYT